MFCPSTWHNVLQNEIYDSPPVLLWWAGSGRFWWPMYLAFVIVLVSVGISFLKSRHAITLERSSKSNPMREINAEAFKQAFWRYRGVVLLVYVTGAVGICLIMGRYSSPCRLFDDLGASGILGKLSPDGIDLVFYSLYLALTITLIWCVISIATAFLVVFDPFSYPVFYLSPKSQDVKFFPYKAKYAELWAKGERKTFTHKYVYFSVDGMTCYLRRPSKKIVWIRLELSDNRNEADHCHVLQGDVKENSVPPHFVKEGGVADDVHSGTVKVGEKGVAYVFMPSR